MEEDADSQEEPLEIMGVLISGAGFSFYRKRDAERGEREEREYWRMLDEEDGGTWDGKIGDEREREMREKREERGERLRGDERDESWGMSDEVRGEDRDGEAEIEYLGEWRKKGGRREGEGGRRRERERGGVVVGRDYRGKTEGGRVTNFVVVVCNEGRAESENGMRFGVDLETFGDKECLGLGGGWGGLMEGMKGRMYGALERPERGQGG
ncbi:hypothetical protein Tco_0559128 [Tanacetum coccineum]